MSMFNIGVVSETLVQQHYLKNAIEDSGYRADLCLLVADLINNNELMNHRASAIDAWVVDVDLGRLDQQSNSREFQEWLYTLEKPVICGEGHTYNTAEPHFISWSRQLKKKLLSLEGYRQLIEKKLMKAGHVWVIAASTGGPEMVKRFLDVMPTDLDVGFLYVQHIDQMQNRVLSETITRDSQYHCSVARHGDVISKDSVTVVPTDNVVELQSNGSMIVYKKEKWRGIYSPSVDQVVANVAKVYGDCAGVIFFSGMGDDGSMGCRLMSLRGGNVWSQLPSSCVADSMPQAAIDSGYVTKIDSPENLAIHLKTLLKAKR